MRKLISYEQMKIIVVFLFGSIVGIFISLFYLMSENTLSTGQHGPSPQFIPESIKVDSASTDSQLIQESSVSDTFLEKYRALDSDFVSTIRNCLGADICYNKKVNDIDRVGLLGVPYSGSKSVMKILHDTVTTVNKIEIIEDSHAPPYGYGFNHGWTRIIRLVRGVLPHALSIVNRSNVSDTHLDGAFDAQIRQIVRWHCRLSHVAAHTMMLTIFADDLVTKPMIELEKILSFSGVKFSRDDLRKAINTHLNELIEEIDYIPNTYSSYQLIPPKLMKIGVDTLRNELDTTKLLTKWPCHSFNSISNKDKLLFAPSVLAPNCSGLHVVCSVPVDIRGA